MITSSPVRFNGVYRVNIKKVGAAPCKLDSIPDALCVSWLNPFFPGRNLNVNFLLNTMFKNPDLKKTLGFREPEKFAPRNYACNAQGDLILFLDDKNGRDATAFKNLEKEAWADLKRDYAADWDKVENPQLDKYATYTKVSDESFRRRFAKERAMANTVSEKPLPTLNLSFNITNKRAYKRVNKQNLQDDRGRWLDPVFSLSKFSIRPAKS